MRLLPTAAVMLAMLSCQRPERPQTTAPPKPTTRRHTHTPRETAAEVTADALVAKTIALNHVQEILASMTKVTSAMGSVQADVLTDTPGSPDQVDDIFARIRALDHVIAEEDASIRNAQKELQATNAELAHERGRNKRQQAAAEALRTSFEQAQQTISGLQGIATEQRRQITELTERVITQAATIEKQEATINQLESIQDSAYYIVGTERDLDEKGIVTVERRGFLHLVRVRRLATRYNESLFKRISASHPTPIPLGTHQHIDFVSPHDRTLTHTQHDGDFYDLIIDNPSHFWTDRHLVIVLE